jgi:beta-lactam-binding protein with PASTA domain/predicted Ser/Thr protein kinase
MTQARLLGGRYQVGELLGYGGMAEVHRGRDLRLGRDVAIKMLRTDLARDDTFQLRFRREAQNAASLNHPAIVAVYDTGEERAATGESLPYIVMEFVNGRTLKEVLAAEGRLMPRRALEITAEISAALEFSHRHGIIHRDIKPGNVMLTQTGQIKVMDFGIARALASGASTMTQTSAVIGTAQYLSPEQARGESVDARSDVYATGCVLYELVCGQPPFVGDSPVSVAYQHVREDAKPPSLLNRDVPPPVDSIVLKALAKNPLNRYQSAGEMRADLLRAAAGRPVYAEPVMNDDDRTMVAGGRPGTGGSRQLPARVGDSRRRQGTTWAIIGLAVLGVIAVVAVILGIMASQRPDQRIVPNLMNLTNSEAQAALTANKLRPAPTAIPGAACGAEGKVRQQSVAAGLEVDENSSVAYEYCSGPNSVPIPAHIVGQDKVAAQNALKALGLTVTFEEVDSDKPKDIVVAANPRVGQTVAEGTPIKLQVSRGNLKRVPDVRDGKYTQEGAIAILNDQGWRYEVVDYGTADPNLVGKVISQDPDPGELKDPTKVTITIAVGVDTSPTPTDPPTDSPG